MRTRLVTAFIVVALLSALAASWFHTLIESYRLPAWLDEVVIGPHWLRNLRYSLPGQAPPRVVPHTALVFFGVEAGLLLAMITTVAIAVYRPVVLPVRRLAQAAQRMSGGDLSVRVEPQGRDELAQLVTTFNAMASALENKVGELERMEARSRQFAGDVSHELRTPLTAMTAVAGILHEHPGLTGDAETAARLVQQEVQHLNRLVEDLIEISRFDAGSAQLVIDETDIANAVSQCLRARGWSTVCACVPAGLTVRLDRRRFDVILANLVGNALRHGGPPVTVKARYPARATARAAGSWRWKCETTATACPPPRSRTYSTGSTKPTRRGRVRRGAAWAWRSPGRTRACMAVTSTRATTRRAARYSPSPSPPDLPRPGPREMIRNESVLRQPARP